MKKILLIIALSNTFLLKAQTYQINFAGTEASSSVWTVKVENISSGTSLTVNGNDILRLTIATGINSKEKQYSSELKIFTNPMVDKAILELYPPKKGNATISIYDMTGRQIIKSLGYLDTSLQSYCIFGLIKGLYLIEAKGNSYTFSGKLLCNSETGGDIKIVKYFSSIDFSTEKIWKSC